MALPGTFVDALQAISLQGAQIRSKLSASLIMTISDGNENP
jgi:hypothetical protein